MKTALITGITGQDGSYLADLLLEQGYRVCGMIRRSSTESCERIHHLTGKVELLQGDLLDPTSLAHVLAETRPDEINNLAAMSFVPTSWQQPVLTGEFTALGVTRLLEAMGLGCSAARFCRVPNPCPDGSRHKIGTAPTPIALDGREEIAIAARSADASNVDNSRKKVWKHRLNAVT